MRLGETPQPRFTFAQCLRLRPARWPVVGCAVTALAVFGALVPSVMQGAEVPVIRGGLGPCTADFTVTDSSNKPLYDAKIRVSILYGFMNKKKQELEIGTNSDGKARFEGLPNKLKKKPLEFQVTSGQLNKSVPHDPEVDCHATFNVTLGSP